jgi:hypothetical protein
MAHRGRPAAEPHGGGLARALALCAPAFARLRRVGCALHRFHAEEPGIPASHLALRYSRRDLGGGCGSEVGGVGGGSFSFLSLIDPLGSVVTI